MLNALTVDVEEYFQVAAFSGHVRRQDWGQYPSRVGASTRFLLDLLDQSGVRATFFFLGWVAERHPHLVRETVSRGHEVGSHGYDHQLIYDMRPEEFRRDIERSKRVVEETAGLPVHGYRAPAFSITPRSLWAFEILAEGGYSFDSSVFPVSHDRYGIPGWERGLHFVANRRLVEAPPTTVRLGPLVLPCAGGGYFRLYPYGLTRAAIRRVNHCERRPAIVYLHPWEFDPEQPRLRGSSLSRFRHYVGLPGNAARLRRLLADFAFAPLGQVVERWRCSQQESVP